MRYIDRKEFMIKFPGMKKKRTDRNMQPRLSIEEVEMVRRMLLGPFKEEWYNFDGIVDNADSTISKRLDLPCSLVALCTNKILKDKENARLFKIEITECNNCANTMFGCKKHKEYYKTFIK